MKLGPLPRYVLLTTVLAVVISVLGMRWVVSRNQEAIDQIYASLGLLLIRTLGEQTPDTFERSFEHLKETRKAFGRIQFEVWYLNKTLDVLAATTQEPPYGLPHPTEIEGSLRDNPSFLIIRRGNFQRLLVSPLANRPDTYVVLAIGPKSIHDSFLAKLLGSVIIWVTIVSTVLSALVLFLAFRGKAGEARAIIRRISDGELGARFRITRLDEVGKLMLSFNLMANEIESLIHRVRASEEQRRKLIGELAHDLRTPLTAVRSTLDTLTRHERELPAAQKHDLVVLARKELAFMQRLLEYVFTLARSGEPILEVNRGEADLIELIKEEIRSRVAFEATQSTPRTWKFKANESQPISLPMDSALVLRMIKNLLDNARKHSSGAITVGVEADDSEFYLTVHSEAQLAETQIFGQRENKLETTSAFQAAQSQTSLGMGSQIIQAIALLHDWDLEVESDTTGTTIRLRGPLPDPHPTQQAA